ncbi:MAG: hypothetical protein VXY34_07760, partial [Bdellovibrionota bacterium]|nr:hypothetical protein [Bdellovibrionota bacterium]
TAKGMGKNSPHEAKISFKIITLMDSYFETLFSLNGKAFQKFKIFMPTKIRLEKVYFINYAQ